MEVLDNVLLNECLSSLVPAALFSSKFVDVCFRKESAVTWDVLGSLRGSNTTKLGFKYYVSS
jgi:hypothetical protein